MVACSLRCKTTHVLFAVAYRFVVPFVCTCVLVRPSEIYAFLLRNKNRDEQCLGSYFLCVLIWIRSDMGIWLRN